jgi:hypothetical protein
MVVGIGAFVNQGILGRVKGISLRFLPGASRPWIGGFCRIAKMDCEEVVGTWFGKKCENRLEWFHSEFLNVAGRVGWGEG